MHCPKPFNTFWVLAQNINNMANAIDYLSWKAATQAIDTSEADAITFQETNLAWNKIYCRWIHQILQKPTGHTAISTSSSTEISTSSHQCRGTLQAILGDWTSHSIQIGQDESSLGCWSFIKLQGREDYCYIILSGYCICKNQMVNLGSNNMFNQQYHLLHQKGHRNPNPRSQFMDDLIKLIQKWWNHSKAILICIDANKNAQNKGPMELHASLLKPIFMISTVFDIQEQPALQPTIKDWHPLTCVPVVQNLITPQSSLAFTFWWAPWFAQWPSNPQVRF